MSMCIKNLQVRLSVVYMCICVHVDVVSRKAAKGKTVEDLQNGVVHSD